MGEHDVAVGDDGGEGDDENNGNDGDHDEDEAAGIRGWDDNDEDGGGRGDFLGERFLACLSPRPT